jgi:hypothetical protein
MVVSWWMLSSPDARPTKASFLEVTLQIVRQSLPAKGCFGLNDVYVFFFYKEHKAFLGLDQWTPHEENNQSA